MEEIREEIKYDNTGRHDCEMRHEEPVPMPAGTEEELLLTAAWVLNAHPLFRYQPDDKELTVLLAGDSPIRSRFLQLIIACAQLPVSGMATEYRQLRIQVMTDCPEAVYQELDACGDLRKYLAIEDRTGTNPPKKPGKAGLFGTLTIQKKNQHKLARQIFKEYNYAILMDEDPQKNADVATELCALLQAEAAKTATGDETQKSKARRAILVGELRPDGAAPGTFALSPEVQHVTCCTFALNGITAEEERASREKMERDAFAVHTYYTKEQNQRVGQRYLQRTFGEYENKYSSVRSALTIPYKLHACKLDDSETPGKELCALLDAYNRNPAGRHPELQTLLHMEHRSWMCFAIMRGWRAPDLKLLKKHAFTKENHGYKLKNIENEKYHPCLVDSQPGQRQLLPLSGYSRNAWEEGRIDAELDLLDQRSLELHRICAHRVAEWENKDEGSYQDLFAKLKERAAMISEESYRRACNLEIVGNKLLRRQTQTDARWHRIVAELTGLVQADADALAALEALRFPMQLVLERNAYRDYKRTDLDLIRAIPEILEPKLVETMYTLLSDTDWCNVVAAILAEPRQLVLLYDPALQNAAQAEECRKLYQKFFDARILPDETGIQDRAVTVACQPLDTEEIADNSALDITGAAPQLLHRALQQKLLQKLPVVCYERGYLQGLTEDGPLWNIYNGHDRSLNVAETMMLGGNVDFSAPLENDLLPLYDWHKVLWETAAAVDADTWNRAASCLVKYASVDYPMDALGKPGQSGVLREALDAATVEKLGLRAVLDELVAKGVLQSWSLSGDDGGLKISSKIKNKEQIARLQSYIGLDLDMEGRYELREVANWSNPGQPAFAIYDRCCAFCAALDLSEIEGEKTRKILNAQFQKELKPLEDLLPILEEEGLVREYNIQKDPSPEVRCTFADEVVRDCLLKAGNALEAFAYHTISDSGLFDDVRPNVYIHWADGDVGASRQTTNEVDIICTKGVRTYFISCKKTGKLDQGFYDQIWYQAHRLGVDAVPVLLYAGRRDFGSETHISRGKRMGVETIVLSPELSADDAALQLEEDLRQILR
jgi:hypothetical protein